MMMDGLPGLNYREIAAQTLKRPLGRMLLLSLALHVAAIILIQPRPLPSLARIVVIEARLDEAKPAPRPEVRPTARPVAVPVEPVPQRPAPVPQEPPPQKAPPPKPAPEEAVPVDTPPPSPTPAVDSAAPSSTPVVATPAQQTAAQAPVTGLPSVPVMVDNNWYDSKQLDVQPRALQPIEPVYPPDAVRHNLHGWVRLMLKVDELGNVRDAVVVESEPPGVFDESALAAFKRARFSAAIRNGLPVRARVYIRVDYRFEDN